MYFRGILIGFVTPSNDSLRLIIAIVVGSYYISNQPTKVNRILRCDNRLACVRFNCFSQLYDFLVQLTSFGFQLALQIAPITAEIFGAC